MAPLRKIDSHSLILGPCGPAGYNLVPAKPGIHRPPGQTSPAQACRTPIPGPAARRRGMRTRDSRARRDQPRAVWRGCDTPTSRSHRHQTLAIARPICWTEIGKVRHGSYSFSSHAPRGSAFRLNVTARGVRPWLPLFEVSMSATLSPVETSPCPRRQAYQPTP